MKNYQLVQEALDKATQKGAFNLQETGYIMGALRGVHSDLQELEQYRIGATANKNLVETEGDKKTK